MQPELTCWACQKGMTFEDRSANDGFCPHCNSEIELDDDEEG